MLEALFYERVFKSKMSICKLQTFTALIVVTGLKLSTGQMPSPQTNPCVLYDLKTGQLELGKVDMHVEIYEERKQTIILPISGRNNSIIEIRKHDAELYGLDLSFNGTHNTMSISKELDRDGISYFAADDFNTFNVDLTCNYTDAGHKQTTVFFKVTVAVKDINDNAPIFINTPYFTTIPETQPVLSTVFEFTAMDKDSGFNAEINYSIQSGNVNPVQTFFDIPRSRAGEIVLKSSLDFDSKVTNLIVLTIIAVDNAVHETQRKTSTGTLTITVEDMDDLPPTFYHDKCRLAPDIPDKCDAVTYRTKLISGQLLPGTPLHVIPIVTGNENRSENIVAFDTDTLNAAIAFEFLDKSQPPGFENYIVLSTSGPAKENNLGNHAIYRATLIQVKPVSILETRRFTLFLKAKQTNDQTKYSIAQIEFEVTASNMFGPNVTTNTGKNVGYLNADDPPGTVVRADESGEKGAIVIVVTDPDLVDGSSQRYNYEIDTAGPTGSTFAIQTTGDRALLFSTQTFDSSTIQLYIVKVRVTEISLKARSGEIIIQVEIQSKKDSKEEKQRDCIVCSDGLYGNHCNLTCPANCVRCNSNTHCIECARGFYGSVCSLHCARKCMLCNKTDGSCETFQDCENNNGQCNEEEAYPVLTLILVAVGSIVVTSVIACIFALLAMRIQRNQRNRSGTDKTEVSSGKAVGQGDENETQFGNYEILQECSRQEFKPYDVLQTSEYEEVGEKT